MLLIPKKKGSFLYKGEFRPVMVTETSYKLFGEIMREKLNRFAYRSGMMKKKKAVGRKCDSFINGDRRDEEEEMEFECDSVRLAECI